MYHPVGLRRPAQGRPSCTSAALDGLQIAVPSRPGLGTVFPSVQSVRLSPRTGRAPSLRPLDGTDAHLQSVLIYARDGRPGPIGVLVYVSYQGASSNELSKQSRTGARLLRLSYIFSQSDVRSIFMDILFTQSMLGNSVYRIAGSHNLD